MKQKAKHQSSRIKAQNYNDMGFTSLTFHTSFTLKFTRYDEFTSRRYSCISQCSQKCSESISLALIDQLL